MSTSKVRTVCGSSARTDLCGGRSERSSLPRLTDKAKPLSRRITALAAVALVLALCGSVGAQQTGKIPRIRYASGAPGSLLFDAFRQGLRDRGYVEGQNLLIEHRDAGGRLDLMPNLVNELVQQKVDIFVASNNVVIRAAQKATQTIPIIMLQSSLDPVSSGYVDTLAHPGGNITGLTTLGRDLSAKRIELLKEILPRISQLAILWDADGPGPKMAFTEYQAAAHRLKLNLQSFEVRGPNPDFQNVFQAIKKSRADTLIIVGNPLLTQHRKQVLELATKNRLPTMNEDIEYVQAGGLLSYAAERVALARRAATYVDKILKGAKPANLPVEQPTKFELVINLKTAKQIGLTIPPNVLARADKVIK